MLSVSSQEVTAFFVKEGFSNLVNTGFLINSLHLLVISILKTFVIDYAPLVIDIYLNLYYGISLYL